MCFASGYPRVWGDAFVLPLRPTGLVRMRGHPRAKHTARRGISHARLPGRLCTTGQGASIAQCFGLTLASPAELLLPQKHVAIRVAAGDEARRYMRSLGVDGFYPSCRWPGTGCLPTNPGGPRRPPLSNENLDSADHRPDERRAVKVSCSRRGE